jgi:hypothetical protein
MCLLHKTAESKEKINDTFHLYDRVITQVEKLPNSQTLIVIMWSCLIGDIIINFKGQF